MNRILAVVCLLCAGGVLYVEHGPSLWSRVVDGASGLAVPAEHQAIAAPVRELLKHHPGRRELRDFYLALADMVPRLPQEATGAQARRWFESAARLQFGETFDRVPGLAAAIHGEAGVIAKIYGLEAGLLDREKMCLALRAVAWACQ